LGTAVSFVNISPEGWVYLLSDRHTLHSLSHRNDTWQSRESPG